MTSGVIHPYYVVAMAPAVAALVGIGVPYIWKAYSRRTKIAWVFPLSIIVTTAVSTIMLGYSNYWPWLTWSVILTGGAAALMTLLPLRAPSIGFKRSALGLAVVAAMSAPVAFTISTVASAHSGSIPTAGPSGTAMQGSNNESASAESALVTYLLANQNGATWVAAVDSANQSAAIQISTGQAVMALGGFNGSDAPLTLAQFKQLVKEGKVRYYITSTSGMGGGGPGGNSEISSWAKSAGTVINYGGSQYTVYDLSSAQ